LQDTVFNNPVKDKYQVLREKIRATLGEPDPHFTERRSHVLDPRTGFFVRPEVLERPFTYVGFPEVRAVYCSDEIRGNELRPKTKKNS